MNTIKPILAFLLLATPALADTISYTAAFSNRTPPQVLPGFDTNLGQLYEVQLAISGTTGGFWFTDPVTSGTLNVTATAMLNGSFVGSGTTSADFAYDTPATFLLLDAPISVNSEIEFDLGRFITTTLSLPVILSPYFTNLDPAAFPSGHLTSYSGSETITYVFGVPEPSSMIMALVATLIVVTLYTAVRLRIRTVAPQHILATRPETMAVVERLMNEHDETLRKLAD